MLANYLEVPLRLITLATCVLELLRLKIEQILGKGVLMHSFSDQSGCSFLHPMSGETVSVEKTDKQLIELLTSQADSTITDQNLLIVNSLVNKGFIVKQAG